MTSLSANALAKKLAISASTLRNWEKHFLPLLSNELKEMKRQENMDDEQALLVNKLKGLRSFLLELKEQL